MAGPPSPDDLPQLPEAWFDALKVDPAEAQRRCGSESLSEVTGAMTGGPTVRQGRQAAQRGAV